MKIIAPQRGIRKRRKRKEAIIFWPQNVIAYAYRNSPTLGDGLLKSSLFRSFPPYPSLWCIPFLF
jgi:hypothetical protein